MKIKCHLCLYLLYVPNCKPWNSSHWLYSFQVEVERIRGQAQDRLMNKLAALRHKAEEKRAAAEAESNRRAAKTDKQAEYICKTGRVPSSFTFCGWFCGWCCWNLKHIYSNELVFLGFFWFQTTIYLTLYPLCTKASPWKLRWSFTMKNCNESVNLKWSLPLIALLSCPSLHGLWYPQWRAIVIWCPQWLWDCQEFLSRPPDAWYWLLNFRSISQSVPVIQFVFYNCFEIIIIICWLNL